MTLFFPEGTWTKIPQVEAEAVVSSRWSSDWGNNSLLVCIICEIWLYYLPHALISQTCSDTMFSAAHIGTHPGQAHGIHFFFQMSDGYSESIHVLRKKQEVSAAWNWKVETLPVVWFLWRGTLEVSEELLPRVDICGFKWSHLEGNDPTHPI